MPFSEIHLSKQIYKHTQQETVVLTKGTKYLIKSLRCAAVVNQPGFARDGFYTDLDQISPHLVACYCCLLLAVCRPYKRLDWCIIIRLRRTTIWIKSSLYIQHFYYTTRNLNHYTNNGDRLHPADICMRIFTWLSV